MTPKGVIRVLGVNEVVVKNIFSFLWHFLH